MPQPVVFLSHGAGPCFFMHDKGGAFSELDADAPITQQYKQLSKHLSNRESRPASILLVSAHWECAGEGVAVTASESPGLLYDFYNFPNETYELEYNASGDPVLARRVAGLLQGAGIPCSENPDRPFDHGMFIPMKLIYPEADIPTVQLSLSSSLDPKLHLRIGEALRPLRDEGVLIIGSGQATHNLRAGIQKSVGRADWAVKFMDWLDDAVLNEQIDAEKRKALFENWEQAPHGREAHPREEHFLPLLVAVGAAGYDKHAAKILDGWYFGWMSMACYVWR